ncbi:hypothetical protein CRV08_07080 [Halarcobacter ebronensis]|uniref:Cytochrome c domain-containing protein n=1 Tax=Halarcobacter ebronensis TaxID=1462615 RepID=A0A4Q0YEN9_9BACT|nr:hypothetical protein [Halarcobacter ebronensis]QKF80644.1 hypothetical protein AEBR_0126 [Halarcobacter ebronensis]RXJ68585.1 hypothetical protein CRV08_07080 [Halarcobacter ebronensis]RXK08445.1 hypothetical protein CRV07_01175 [Halarcobacter ebronensis]
MKVIVFLFIILGSLYALPPEFDRQRYELGEKVFEKKCQECHVKSMPIDILMKNFIEENNETLKLKAPTGNEISYRLKSQIGSKEDIEFQLHEAMDFVIDYLYNPNKAKTICLEGVIKHFDTMPSMKGKITKEEIKDVTFFLYFLEGFNGVNKFYHDETEF